MLEGREAHFLSIEKVNIELEEASGDFLHSFFSHLGFSSCSHCLALLKSQ